MSSIAFEQTPSRRDRKRSLASRQRTLQRRVTRWEKYGADPRRK